MTSSRTYARTGRQETLFPLRVLTPASPPGQQGSWRPAAWTNNRKEEKEPEGGETRGAGQGHQAGVLSSELRHQQVARNIPTLCVLPPLRPKSPNTQPNFPGELAFQTLFSISVRAQVPQCRHAVLLCPSAYPVPRVDFITEFQVRASEVPDETKLLLFLHPRCYFLSSGVVFWSLHYSVSLLTNVEAS
ncbi:hypothetical protein P7K49_039275, partial [Saguinus oedipus]